MGARHCESTLRMGLGLCVAGQCLCRGNGRIEIRERQEELLLANPIEALRVQRHAFAQAVVEHAKSAANHVLRRFALEASQSPGESDARPKIRPVSAMRLRFVPQSAAQGEVGPQFPIILKEEAEIGLTDCRHRIAAGNGELAGAAARRADLLGREPTLQAEHGQPVTVERSEGEGAGVVLRRPVVERDRSQQTAPPEIVRAADQRGEVLQFEAILIGVRKQLGRAAADEGIQDVDGGRRVGSVLVAACRR